MRINRRRIVSVSLVLLMIVSGLIAIAPASLAESEGEISKMQIDGLSWDTTNQEFVVALSLKFGLATAGEHADFLIATTLKIDANGISVTLNGESNILKAEGAIKDSENMIRIEHIIIPWDRLINGQKFVGFADVYVDTHMSHFSSGQNARLDSANAAYRGTSVSGCTSNSECDDGIICNGEETCNVETGECEAGTPPPCNDGTECTLGYCDPSTGCDFSSPCTPLPPTPTD
jgi:hypothetical protein